MSAIPGNPLEDFDVLAIQQAGDTASIRSTSCSFDGTYVQQGQVGTLTGSYSCAHRAGRLTLTDLRLEQTGMLARYTVSDAACEYEGRLAAVRAP